MKKYLPLLLILLLPIKTLAKCTDSDRVKLHKLASNVTFSYEYVEKDNRVTFNIIVTNLTKDLILYEKSNNREYNQNGELTIKGYGKDDIAKFYIYAKDDTCISSPLISNIMNFPSYNPFYKDDICKQIPNYTYCKKWINNPYDYETFKKNAYKFIEENKKQKIEEEKQVEQVKSMFDYLGEFYVRFYYLILPTIIVICFAMMYKLNKKNKLV